MCQYTSTHVVTCMPAPSPVVHTSAQSERWDAWPDSTNRVMCSHPKLSTRANSNKGDRWGGGGGCPQIGSFLAGRVGPAPWRQAFNTLKLLLEMALKRQAKPCSPSQTSTAEQPRAPKRRGEKRGGGGLLFKSTSRMSRVANLRSLSV